jgi:hypothetical protein
MTPLEFIHKIMQLIPVPRSHIVRYFGVLAPHAKLRAKIISESGPLMAQGTTQAVTPQPEKNDHQKKDTAPEQKKKKIPYLWAILIARIYEILPLECHRCHKEMKILSFITQNKEFSVKNL